MLQDGKVSAIAREMSHSRAKTEKNCGKTAKRYKTRAPALIPFAHQLSNSRAPVHGGFIATLQVVQQVIDLQIVPV